MQTPEIQNFNTLDNQNNQYQRQEILINQANQQFTDEKYKIQNTGQIVQQISNILADYNMNFERFLSEIQDVSRTILDLNDIKNVLIVKFQVFPNLQELKEIYQKNIQKQIQNRQIKRNWNEDDLQILIFVVYKYQEYFNKSFQKFSDFDWQYIGKIIPGKNTELCKYKWLSLLRLSIQQVPWTKQEDEILLDLVNIKGKSNWSEIAKLLYERADSKIFRQSKKCRERYNNHLDPEIKKGTWSKKEDKLLFKLVQQHGKKWAVIAKLVEGRTENAVKNRYNALKKREDQTNGNQSPFDSLCASNMSNNWGNNSENLEGSPLSTHGSIGSQESNRSQFAHLSNKLQNIVKVQSEDGHGQHFKEDSIREEPKSTNTLNGTQQQQSQNISQLQQQQQQQFQQKSTFCTTISPTPNNSNQINNPNGATQIPAANSNNNNNNNNNNPTILQKLQTKQQSRYNTSIDINNANDQCQQQYQIPEIDGKMYNESEDIFLSESDGNHYNRSRFNSQKIEQTHYSLHQGQQSQINIQQAQQLKNDFPPVNQDLLNIKTKEENFPNEDNQLIYQQNLNEQKLLDEANFLLNQGALIQQQQQQNQNSLQQQQLSKLEDKNDIKQFENNINEYLNTNSNNLQNNLTNIPSNLTTIQTQQQDQQQQQQQQQTQQQPQLQQDSQNSQSSFEYLLSAKVQIGTQEEFDKKFQKFLSSDLDNDNNQQEDQDKNIEIENNDPKNKNNHKEVQQCYINFSQATLYLTDKQLDKIPKQLVVHLPLQQSTLNKMCMIDEIKEAEGSGKSSQQNQNNMILSPIQNNMSNPYIQLEDQNYLYNNQQQQNTQIDPNNTNNQKFPQQQQIQQQNSPQQPPSLSPLNQQSFMNQQDFQIQQQFNPNLSQFQFNQGYQQQIQQTGFYLMQNQQQNLDQNQTTLPQPDQAQQLIPSSTTPAGANNSNNPEFLLQQNKQQPQQTDFNAPKPQNNSQQNQLVFNGFPQNNSNFNINPAQFPQINQSQTSMQQFFNNYEDINNNNTGQNSNGIITSNKNSPGTQVQNNNININAQQEQKLQQQPVSQQHSNNNSGQKPQQQEQQQQQDSNKQQELKQQKEDTNQIKSLQDIPTSQNYNY